jgi:flagellar biosynthesis protein FlhF
MELKRILAKDTRSANEKAIQLYGQDVLVISTQKVGEQIELIVATDAQAAQAAHEEMPSQKQDPALALRQEKDQVFAEIFGFVQKHENALGIHNDTPLPLKPEVAATAVREPVSASAEPVPQEPLSVNPSCGEGTAQKKPTSTHVSNRRKPRPTAKKSANRAAKSVAPSGEREPMAALHMELSLHRACVDMLREEVQVLRREMQLQRQVLPWQATQGLSPEASNAAQELTQLGVPVGLRTLLIDAVKDEGDAPAVRQAMRDALKSHLAVCVGEPIGHGVHALVGPSGSGKTHMVVRLAHMASLTHGVDSQAIISYADTRPGAWSQIQMLCASVGVEVFRATTPQALSVLLEELRLRKGIWIDTAGSANFMVEEEILVAHPDIQWHAVAPLDASATTMRRLQAHTLVWRSLMLTKSDESSSVWQWMQALSEKQMCISHVSNSEQVKHPALGFDPDVWADLAMSDLPAVVPKTVTKTKRTSASKRPTPQKAAHE